MAKYKHSIPKIVGAGEEELEKAAVEFLYIFGITNIPKSEVPLILDGAIKWLENGLGGGKLQEVIKRAMDAHQTAGIPPKK